MANDAHGSCAQEVPDPAEEDFRFSGGGGRVRLGKVLTARYRGRYETRGG